MNSDVDTSEADYRRAVEERILSCLRGGPKSFEELVLACDGAYPPLVAEGIRGLGSKVRPSVREEYVVADVAFETGLPTLAVLEGNPVLCSWYFAEQSCENIARMRSWDASRLAFLGTPRLFEWFEGIDVGARRVLFELDPTVVSLLSQSMGRSDRIVRYDAHDSIPGHFRDQFDVVFFDPPWYPNDYLLWLARATELSARGTVIFPLLPSLTRPSAATDRALILEQSRYVAKQVTILSEYVSYDVPSFERFQLEAGGINGLRSWKRADLVLLDRNGVECSPPTPSRKAIEEWIEIDVGRVRFFLQQEPRVPRVEGPLLDRLAGQVGLFISPSRRDPLRALANVRTSRGHALRTGDPQRLAEILRVLAQHTQAGDLVAEVISRCGADLQTKHMLTGILVEVDHE